MTNVPSLFVLLLLNAVLVAGLYFIGVPRAYAAVAQRRSGKDYNRKYSELLEQRGPENDLDVPNLVFVQGTSDIRWPKPWLKRLWRYRIRGVGLFGLVHMSAVAAATFVATILGPPGVDSSTVLTSAALLIASLFIFTRVIPRIGRAFRGPSRLLAAGMLLLWLTWMVSVLNLGSNSQYWYASLLTYAIVWLALAFGALRRPRRFPLNLLILRVFGSFRRNFFLFEVLQPLWNQVGGVFAVTSPEQAFFRPTTLGTLRKLGLAIAWILLLFAQIAVLLAVPEQSPLAYHTALVFLPVLAHLPVYALLQWAVAGAFVSDETDVYTPLVHKLQRSAAEGKIANLQFACYDDDWKIVVESLASMADCVLFDLRGFTSANAGAAYELGFMVNNVRLENVLGLADRTTDIDAVRRILADHWRHMSETSWNYRSGVRDLVIYKRDVIGSRDAASAAAWLMGKAVRQDQFARYREPVSGTGEDIPVVVWDRGVDGRAWLYLTWLPEGAEPLAECPYADADQWKQATDARIRTPFSVKTQAPGANEDESVFWRGMADKVDETIRSR